MVIVIQIIVEEKLIVANRILHISPFTQKKKKTKKKKKQKTKKKNMERPRADATERQRAVKRRCF